MKDQKIIYGKLDPNIRFRTPKNLTNKSLFRGYNTDLVGQIKKATEMSADALTERCKR
jgi:hypothetical protein